MTSNTEAGNRILNKSLKAWSTSTRQTNCQPYIYLYKADSANLKTI